MDPRPGRPPPQWGVAPPAAYQPLPIEDYAGAILKHIAQHRVTFIQGETGCGKSSMVPQFILRQNPQARMFVTQPRRFAAISLARRVGEQLGDERLVGYRLGRGERKEAPETRITFCTTGYLVQLLSFNPGVLRGVTHVVLDEVHERSMDADMLLLIMKLSLRVHPTLRLVIMSATLQPELFCNYFADVHASLRPLAVGARRFAVDVLFLDELHRLQPAARLVNQPVYRDALQSLSLQTPRLGKPMEALIVALLEALARPKACILVFLPGSAEIDAVQFRLQRARLPCPVQVLPLLAMIPAGEQDKVMQPNLPGHCKVVLATNVAESSVTIPDVQYVLDAGLQRGVFTDERSGRPTLQTRWVSRASAKQRAGRAGRLSPGTVLHLFPASFHHTGLKEHDEAEMEHAALETTVISTKLLFRRFGTVRDVLAMVISPPPATRVDSAFQQLYSAGALTSPGDGGEVTAVGHLAVQLRLELPLIRLIFFGHALGLLLEAVVLAACHAQGDLFSMPTRLFITDPARFMSAVAKNFIARWDADNGRYSEPLANFTLYLQWLHGEREDNISIARARAATVMAADICQSLLTENVLPLSEAAAEQLRQFQSLAAGQPPQTELFPQRDPYLLYVLLATASAPLFMHGREAPGNPAGQIYDREMDINRTAVLQGLPPTVMTGDQLRRLVDCPEVRVTQAEVVEGLYIHSPDGVVELAPRGPPRCEDEGRVLQDVDLSCKLLHQWFVQNNERLVVVGMKDSAGAPVEVDLQQGLAFPNAMEWVMCGANPELDVTVKFNGRSPLALTVEEECSTLGWSPHVAVAFSTIGMFASNRLFANGVTILPFPAFGNLLMLLMARSVDRVQLLPTYSEEISNPMPVAFFISAVKLSCYGDEKEQTLSFAPYFMDHSHFTRINAIRGIVSGMVRGEKGAAARLHGEVTALLEEMYFSREATAEELMREASTWPWMDVECAEAEDRFDYLPVLLLKADRFVSATPWSKIPKAVRKHDRWWHNTYREFRMLVRLYLDRHENRLDLSILSSIKSLTGPKGKYKLQRLGFQSLYELFQSMPDMVTVEGEKTGPWYLQGVQAATPLDPLRPELQPLPYENDKSFKMDERLLADRQKEWSPKLLRVWQELRSKVKRSIIRHPKGVSLARYIERYRFDRPMAKAKMMNLGFRDVLDLLYGMPDLVSIRFVRDYSVSALPYVVVPTELLQRFAEMKRAQQQEQALSLVKDQMDRFAAPPAQPPPETHPVGAAARLAEGDPEGEEGGEGEGEGEDGEDHGQTAPGEGAAQPYTSSAPSFAGSPTALRCRCACHDRAPRGPTAVPAGPRSLHLARGQWQTAALGSCSVQ